VAQLAEVLEALSAEVQELAPVLVLVLVLDLPVVHTAIKLS
jgi:hypothetical protein